MAGSASVSGEPLLRRGLRVLSQVKEGDGEDFGLRDVERDARIGRGKADRRKGERARGGEDDHSISHLMIPVSVRDGSAAHTTGVTPTACRGGVAETLVGIIGIAELRHAPHAEGPLTALATWRRTGRDTPHLSSIVIPGWSCRPAIPPGHSSMQPLLGSCLIAASRAACPSRR